MPRPRQFEVDRARDERGQAGRDRAEVREAGRQAGRRQRLCGDRDRGRPPADPQKPSARAWLTCDITQAYVCASTAGIIVAWWRPPPETVTWT